MTREESKLSTGPVEEQALHWLRVLTDQPTNERLDAFTKWIDASPHHLREFYRVQRVENCLQDFLAARPFDVDVLIKEVRQERQQKLRLAWAAAMVAAVALGGVLLAVNVNHDAEKQIYATTETHGWIELADGSVVALNAQSAIQVAFSGGSRDLYLTQGQGTFSVRHDATRPFRVHAGTAVFEAIGTRFDVRLAREQAFMAVVNGVVQLKSPPSFMSAVNDILGTERLPKLTAGQSVIVDHEGRVNGIKPVDVIAVTAWQESEGELVFKDQPLSVIADEFNRRNAAQKLRIEGDALRARHYRIRFNTASPELLINHLRADQTLEFVREGNDIVIREHDH